MKIIQAPERHPLIELAIFLLSGLLWCVFGTLILALTLRVLEIGSVFDRLFHDLRTWHMVAASVLVVVVDRCLSASLTRPEPSGFIVLDE